jgi:hypothetical protein
MGIKLAFVIFLTFIPVQHIIDDGQQPVIPSVKHDAGQFLFAQFSPLLVKTPQTVLGNPKCAFSHQADLDQRVRIIDGGIRISDNAMGTDKSIHETFPSIVRRLFINLDFLSFAKSHNILQI